MSDDLAKTMKFLSVRKKKFYTKRKNSYLQSTRLRILQLDFEYDIIKALRKIAIHR